MNSQEAINLLGLPSNYTPDELKSAYRKASKKYHPDMTGGDESIFIQVNKAYQLLLSGNSDDSLITPPDFTDYELKITYNDYWEEIHNELEKFGEPLKIKKNITLEQYLFEDNDLILKYEYSDTCQKCKGEDDYCDNCHGFGDVNKNDSVSIVDFRLKFGDIIKIPNKGCTFLTIEKQIIYYKRSPLWVILNKPHSTFGDYEFLDDILTFHYYIQSFEAAFPFKLTIIIGEFTKIELPIPPLDISKKLHVIEVEKLKVACRLHIHIVDNPIELKNKNLSKIFIKDNVH
jgi:hypothetical protein